MVSEGMVLYTVAINAMEPQLTALERDLVQDALTQIHKFRYHASVAIESDDKMVLFLHIYMGFIWSGQSSMTRIPLSLESSALYQYFGARENAST